jgi:hypothetical protein
MLDCAILYIYVLLRIFFCFCFKVTSGQTEVSQRRSIFQKFYWEMKSSPSGSDVTELISSWVVMRTCMAKI